MELLGYAISRGQQKPAETLAKRALRFVNVLDTEDANSEV